MSSNAKTAMGIVNCPLLVADEPGAWEATGGQLMSDAIETALGKPGSQMKVIYIGTLAPAMFGWWHELVENGSTRTNYVQALQADPEKWDDWNEIRRVNPLTAISPEFRRRLLVERDEARLDPRKKSRFFSYRLNIPTPDETQMLLSTHEWRDCETENLPPRQGPMVWGVDLGTSAAMSAVSAYWPATGRSETLAAFPDKPDLLERGKKDGVGDLYQRMEDRGELVTTPGRTVILDLLLAHAFGRWGKPDAVATDAWRDEELIDALEKAGVPPAALEVRRMGWRDGGDDVRWFRRAVAEGWVKASVSLLMRSALSDARVVGDSSGNYKFAKGTQGGRRSTHRDDAAAAEILGVAAGARWRFRQMGDVLPSADGPPPKPRELVTIR